MQQLRSRLRLWAFAAMFAVLGMAVAPAVSQAAMALSGSRWVEVCSAAGSRWLEVDAAPGQAAGPKAAGPMGDMPTCPLCCPLNGDAGPPPPAAPRRVAWMGGADAVPALFLRAPRPMFAWAAPQPRGPPVAG